MGGEHDKLSNGQILEAFFADSTYSTGCRSRPHAKANGMAIAKVLEILNQFPPVIDFSTIRVRRDEVRQGRGCSMLHTTRTRTRPMGRPFGCLLLFRLCEISSRRNLDAFLHSQCRCPTWITQDDPTFCKHGPTPARLNFTKIRASNVEKLPSELPIRQTFSSELLWRTMAHDILDTCISFCQSFAQCACFHAYACNIRAKLRCMSLD